MFNRPVLISGNFGLTQGYPISTTSNWLSHINKIGDKPTIQDDAEKSFQHFINTNPEPSTVIAHIKPNASELEMLILKNKIASTILRMQEMDRPSESARGDRAECYIEITKVDRIPGRCQKVSNGLPVCQSDNYLSLNSDCM